MSKNLCCYYFFVLYCVAEPIFVNTAKFCVAKIVLMQETPLFKLQATEI